MATKHKWIITKDHFADLTAKPGTNCNAVGVEGPRDCDDRTADQLPDSFRMFDDDGELVCEGKCDCLVNGPEGGFEPLDDFGMPNYGCTYIEYLDPATGKWNML